MDLNETKWKLILVTDSNLFFTNLQINLVLLPKALRKIKKSSRIEISHHDENIPNIKTKVP